MLLSFVVVLKLRILGNNCNTIGTIAILLLGTLSLLGQYYWFQNWGQYYCNTIFPSPAKDTETNFSRRGKSNKVRCVEASRKQLFLAECTYTMLSTFQVTNILDALKNYILTRAWEGHSSILRRSKVYPVRAEVFCRGLRGE